MGSFLQRDNVLTSAETQSNPSPPHTQTLGSMLFIRLLAHPRDLKRLCQRWLCPSRDCGLVYLPKRKTWMNIHPDLSLLPLDPVTRVLVTTRTEWFVTWRPTKVYLLSPSLSLSLSLALPHTPLPLSPASLSPSLSPPSLSISLTPLSLVGAISIFFVYLIY